MGVIMLAGTGLPATLCVQCTIIQGADHVRLQAGAAAGSLAAAALTVC
jgi:hypothetical protein